MSEHEPKPQRPPAPTRSPLSIRVGRFFGIDVIIHWSFWLLFAFVGYIAWEQNLGLPGFLHHAALVASIFVCVVLHEFGHALTARRFGIGTRDITLLPIGGVARLQGMPEKPAQEILVALAGPAVNVVIALLLAPIIFAIRGAPALEDFAPFSGDFLAELAAINIFLVVFNMIPAFPMDGGRVLRAALAIPMGRVDATRAAAMVGQVLAVGFALVAMFVIWNPFLLLIAIFVFFGGRAEAQAVSIQAAFAGLTADRAMMTDFDALAPDDTLGHAADTLLAGSQHEFPVFDDAGRPVGILTRAELIQGIERLGSDADVSTVMRPSTLAIERRTPLRQAVERMNAAEVSAAPVFEGERIVGLLTLENAGELAALRHASARARRP
jgi:Zn-dependent protease/predicted transcriptional regulator